MYILAIIPFLLQAICIGIDEIYFHYKRGLPKWERIGHPLDTLSVLICMYMILYVPFSFDSLKIYIGLSIFSCIMVTKDEFVHKHFCPPLENWLHAVLFTLHPMVLAVTGMIWTSLHTSSFVWISWLSHPLLGTFLYVQTFFMTLFFFYQIIFWNFIWKDKIAIKH